MLILALHMASLIMAINMQRMIIQTTIMQTTIMQGTIMQSMKVNEYLLILIQKLLTLNVRIILVIV
jgi:hypothetical protein